MLTHVLMLLTFMGQAQQTTQPSPASERLAAWEHRETLQQSTLFNHPRFKNTGPIAMGGRVIAVQGFSEQPHTYFAAYASGGLWRTDDNGITWSPLFENNATITIGDIAVNPKNLNEIWVGTGEDNSSRSSYAGSGIYYTSDGGKSWTHMGLSDTHHISTVVIHPRNPDIVWVSAIGHLYSTNEERGVFKTTDRGKTWKKVLYVNDNTGVIDLVVDPTNPKRLYATAWERSRKAWNFEEAGPGSGVYVSKDGGDSWKLSNDGLPVGPKLGRIGLAVSPVNPKVIYAIVDNQQAGQAEEEDDDRPLTRRKLQEMDKDTFLKIGNRDIAAFLRQNRFHSDIKPAGIKKDLKSGALEMEDIRSYLYDSNRDLFSANVIGVEIFRSDNRGKTWKKTHEEPIEGFAFSYGYYFGKIRTDPNDVNTVYILGVPLLKSTDGGKNWELAMTRNVHVDHHDLWISPNNSKQLVLGNDGGVCMSWDGGQNWEEFNFVPAGQFYTLTYDMAKPYRIYGGLQDNGVWYGTARERGRYDRGWERLGGGDGAFVQVDFRDNDTVYFGSQFGSYTRSKLTDRSNRLRIFPRHRLKEDPLRYNWMTPIVLSRHVPDVLYMGAQRVLRSTDQGKTFEPISDDLSHNPNNVGDVPFGTISMLAESPHRFGRLYAGTDDGRLWISNGGEWNEISGEMTKGLWISGIEVSPHQEGTVFVTLTGYRNDDFSTYVYMSDNFGKTWKDIRGDLPQEACNVIRQDPHNANILYLGTDVGLWVSFNMGANWAPLQSDLPNVPVYAMEIHPRDKDLIVATHGRSVFMADTEVLSQFTPEILDSDLHVFKVDNARFSQFWGRSFNPWRSGPSPGSDIHFFTKDEVAVTVEIMDKDEQSIFKTDIDAAKGYRIFQWGYQVTQIDDPDPKTWHKGADEVWYAQKGVYKIVVTAGGKSAETSIEIK